jgi:CheY-like chemotaxis protein
MAKRRILVVEDDPETRDGVRQLLEDSGYDVRIAASAREAFSRLLDEEQPALIILDIRPPALEGRELVKLTRAYHRLSSIPLLVLSSSALPGGLPGVVEMIMVKPFKPEDLLTNVQGLLAQGDGAVSGALH